MALLAKTCWMKNTFAVILQPVYTLLDFGGSWTLLYSSNMPNINEYMHFYLQDSVTHHQENG